MKIHVVALISLLLLLAAGCSFIGDSNAETEAQAELEKLSDQELVELAEEIESGQAIAGQATRMSSWSRVPSGARSKMMVKELSRRLSKYAISDEPAFRPKDDETSEQRGDGSVSISDDPVLSPKGRDGSVSTSDEPAFIPKAESEEEDKLIGENG